MRARNAAIVGIGAALVVAAIAIARRKTAVVPPAVESTHAVRIVRRDRVGLPEKQGTIRDPIRVRSITAALGIDDLPGAPCPADYADADFGIVLSGSDVYAKRNVYVYGLLGDAAAPTVVSVTSAGCRVGPPASLPTLRDELRTAGTLAD